MADRKTVIKGLQDMLTHDPYYFSLQLIRNAIELLENVEEPIKPIKHYIPDGKRKSAAWQCGNCLIDIGYGTNYCYNCGREVKWD